MRPGTPREIEVLLGTLSGDSLTPTLPVPLTLSLAMAIQSVEEVGLPEARVLKEEEILLEGVALVQEVTFEIRDGT